MARRIGIGRILTCGTALLPLLLAFRPAFAAEPAPTQQDVDVALVLAVDVSLSMSPEELEIQRRGYAAALRDDRVIAAITDGYLGRIAIAFFEWAGSSSQTLVVPWTLVASREDAEKVAERLSAEMPNSARRTSISSALAYAGDLFVESPYRATKRVVDVSGDGANNQGGPVALARDALVGQGITVNGLPLMTNSGYVTAYDVPDLDKYYANCVIGGPGSFMIPVNDWQQFPEAVRRKLVLELAGAGTGQSLDSAGIVFAQASAPYDCEVGERFWRSRPWAN